MTKPLAIFGLGQLAEVAWFYFKHDSEYDINCFVVDAEYKQEGHLLGIPILTTEEFLVEYKPENCSLFVAIGYTGINKIRAEKVKFFKSKGYELASYVSSQAVTWPDFSCGVNCFILEQNTIQPFVKIGDNCMLWSGNHIGHHTVIEDNCFITSHVVVSGCCTIGAGSFIGVNATIRDATVIGAHNVIGAGTVILKNTENDQVFKSQHTEAAKVPSYRLRGI